MHQSKTIIKIRIIYRSHSKIQNLTKYFHPKIHNNLNLILNRYKNHNIPNVYKKYILLTKWLKYPMIKRVIKVFDKIKANNLYHKIL